MKKLITIILALIMTLFSVPDQGADGAARDRRKNATDGDDGTSGGKYPKTTKQPQKRRLWAKQAKRELRLIPKRQQRPKAKL